jgi:hypothetical protein
MASQEKRPRVLLFVLVILYVVLAVRNAFAQHTPSGYSSASFKLSPRDSIIQLPDRFLLSESESVFLDSTKLLRFQEYDVDYRSGRIVLHRDPLRRLTADSLDHTLLVVYRAVPFAFKSEYVLRTKTPLRDSLGIRTAMPLSSASPLEDLSGSALQKSGFLARGLSLGTNRDLSLSSGFRMQLSGNLAHDVGIVAALTDERTPIQPEGTTQTLREVDKVFVEVRAPSYSATLGDFHLTLDSERGGEFGRLTRKLQGASGSLRFGDTKSFPPMAALAATAATQRGKFHSNQFLGVEGNQGPYPLTGRNGERRIVVVAGSERVYLNGELLTRGETNDYTIDYASGEVVFTSRRLITHASRITVDFEYTDREFTRNLLAGSGAFSLAGDNVKLNALIVQEADDPDSPVEATLDDSTRSLLRQSGADRLRASLPGARFVGRDSAGLARGYYVMKDTLINGRRYTMYVYAPGDSLALYSVSFSPVDRMPPDSLGYVRVGVGHFKVAGVGQGNYLPLQFLPLPQLHRVLDLNGSAELGSSLSITGEYAISQFDRNRLSTFDDVDQHGVALKVGLLFRPRNVLLAGIPLGSIDLSLSERFVDRRFAALDRVNDVEFDRQWGLEPGGRGNEEIREVRLSIRPNERLNLSAGYGMLNLQDSFRSRKFSSDLLFHDSSSISLRYQGERIQTNDIAQQLGSEWTRQRGSAEYSWWKLQPAIRVESEMRALLSTRPDSLRAGSFRFVELAPRLATSELGSFRATAEYQIRQEDSVIVGSLERASRTLTQLYVAEFQQTPTLSTQLSLSIRKTRFTDLFMLRGNGNADVSLVRWQFRYAPLQRAADASVLYEFSNQRAARLERVFVRVPRGTGNYRYRGDLNNNGVAEENEFELTRFDGDYIVWYAPGEQLVPVSDLKMSARLRLEPARILRDRTPFWDFLRRVSTETFFRVEERSTEPDASSISFLHFSRFLNETTTLAGSRTFTQDVHLNEFDPDFSLRFRFLERRGLLQLVSGVERSATVERSVRLRAQLLPEIGNQTEFVNKIDRVTASMKTLRERDMRSNALSADFSYRPEPAWEVGFRVEVSRVIDYSRRPNPVADINEQSLRINYALFGAGQARAELRREEAGLSQGTPDPANPFPFEFTGGRVLGRSMLWQLAFDYRISQHMQVTLQYNGRKEGTRPAVHLGQAEAKLFF